LKLIVFFDYVDGFFDLRHFDASLNKPPFHGMRFRADNVDTYKFMFFRLVLFDKLKNLGDVPGTLEVKVGQVEHEAHFSVIGVGLPQFGIKRG